MRCWRTFTSISSGEEGHGVCARPRGTSVPLTSPPRPMQS
ncbi:hypothetical protein AB0L74_07330 [Streptomyces sp. NPDC052020]